MAVDIRFVQLSQNNFGKERKLIYCQNECFTKKKITENYVWSVVHQLDVAGHTGYLGTKRQIM